MKTCTKCNIEKSFEDFNWRNKRKGRRQSYCNACQKMYSNNHYQNNRKYYIDKAHDYDSIIHAMLSQIKEENPCHDCGIYYDAVCIDFDHVPGEKKLMNLSQFNQGSYSFDKVVEEIQKCDIVCSNCHRLRTKNRRTLSSIG